MVYNIYFRIFDISKQKKIKKMIKRTKQIDIFIAKDGKEFYNQKDCIY